MNAAAPRRRIAFVINSLGPGGAERVLDNILHVTPAGWECHLVLLDREPEHRIPPAFVNIHRLDCKLGLIASIRCLRKEFRSIRPDLIVSFLVRANVACIIAARVVGAPVIISERSNLSTHLAGRHAGWRYWMASLMPRLTYPRAQHIIAVSEGVRSDLIEKFAVSPERVTSIPNPYDLGKIGRDAEAKPEIALPEKFMIGVGRLVGSKGFADLIEAYFQARIDTPLCILGEGPDRGRLEAQIAALGLANRIHLLGYLKNPFAVVGRADLFVSASHCEGFPNAMAEAMALGVPAVATDCPSGPAEILDGVEAVHSETAYEGKFGMLVPVNRPVALARAIRMMSEPERRKRYSGLARQRMDDFQIGAIADRYWRTFDSVLAATAPERARREAGSHVRAGNA